MTVQGYSKRVFKSVANNASTPAVHASSQNDLVCSYKGVTIRRRVPGFLVILGDFAMLCHTYTYFKAAEKRLLWT